MIAKIKQKRCPTTAISNAGFSGFRRTVLEISLVKWDTFSAPITRTGHSLERYVAY